MNLLDLGVGVGCSVVLQEEVNAPSVAAALEDADSLEDRRTEVAVAGER